MNNVDVGLVLSFVASLTLCDHMGDVENAISTLFKRLDLDIRFWDMNALRKELSKRGVLILNGTPLTE